MKLTIVVTVYNEKGTILRAIEEAKALAIEKQIIIIDNCSSDGTREILKKIDDGSVKIIFQPQNYGYGKSIKTGVSLADGEFIYIHNSDLEYGIECVYRMLPLAEKFGLDAVFGSRLCQKLRGAYSTFLIIKNRPYYLGTLVTTFLINLFYGRKFTDIIGTRFYRTSSFKKINIESNDICFDFELVSMMCEAGFKIEEVPVSYKARKAKEGKKVKALDIIPAVMAIIKIKFFNNF